MRKPLRWPVRRCECCVRQCHRASRYMRKYDVGWTVSLMERSPLLPARKCERRTCMVHRLL